MGTDDNGRGAYVYDSDGRRTYVDGSGDRPRKRIGGARVFCGIAFILVAVAIILNVAGVIAFDGLSAGDIVWTAALVVVMILCIPHRIWFGIFFPLAGLLIIFDKPLGIDTQDISLWAFMGVALLLSIGFSILFHKRKHHRSGWSSCGDGTRAYVYGSAQGEDAMSGSVDSVDGSVVRVEVNFSNVIKYVNSTELERVEAECNFGAVKLYFDNAKPGPNGALIMLDVSFGSAELFIPATWSVNNELKRSFSAVDEQGRIPSSAERTSRVTIVGEASFSGVNIIYV
jgi:hypothetical protein